MQFLPVAYCTALCAFVTRKEAPACFWTKSFARFSVNFAWFCCATILHHVWDAIKNNNRTHVLCFSAILQRFGKKNKKSKITKCLKSLRPPRSACWISHSKYQGSNTESQRPLVAIRASALLGRVTSACLARRAFVMSDKTSGLTISIPIHAKGVLSDRGQGSAWVIWVAHTLSLGWWLGTLVGRGTGHRQCS